jgi:MFS superfamily sulfate permease-like transporter
VVIPKAMAYATVAVLAALFLSPFIALMPHAALAGVVIVYSLGLIQPAEFRDMLRVRRTEFIWAVIAMLGVMTLGTLQGILVAIIVSLVALGKVANPRVYVLGREPGTTKFRPRSPEHPNDEFEPGLLLVRLEGRCTRACWCSTCARCSTSNTPRSRCSSKPRLVAAPPASSCGWAPCSPKCSQS